MSCPFKACLGHSTADARQHWMDMHGNTDVDESLSAKPDGPLFFWQLYSLMGAERIERILHAFYTRVYADNEEPWFRRAFSQIGDLEHHVERQTEFWIDAFGGGPQYHGGDGRINIHHQHRAAHIMNARGAGRWMYHMTLALNDDTDWSEEDPRVKPCLVDFLETRMRKYAAAHRWEFDAHDFDLLRVEFADNSPTVVPPKDHSTAATPSHVGSSPSFDDGTSSVDEQKNAQSVCH
uniref:Globin n=1 Tax=Noctiluca scintillans TaxID=2966 RepID=A0A7S1A307_NOCSC|mmetsp:Transcript_29280/g.77389  ORF Transcript_29280/g.77389 Transcript_29280/m.77389 type:complete len:236 (+) Transcript_29280:50-757(+)